MKIRPGAGRARERTFWRAIRDGLATSASAEVAGVSGSLGKLWFRDSGGMSPLDLAEPSGRYLSLGEREEIAVGVAAGLSLRQIARVLGRSASTVSREVRRNRAASRGQPPYRATLAQALTERRRRRPKPRKLAGHERLRVEVQTMLEQRMSPEQISGRLPLLFPDDASMRVSPEVIYQCLYIQGRGGLRRELVACLRTGRALRRPRRRVDQRSVRPRIPDKVMISQRPAEAADRAVPGHWEGDLIIGADNQSAIGTVVERTSRLTLLLHLPDGYGAAQVRNAIITAMADLPAQLRRSLTWDQGIEMAQHVKIKTATNMPVFFCDPHSPWQRGTNENTNGLLRQYFPKGTDLSLHTADDLAAVQAELNARPRKTLGFYTPAEVFARTLHADSVATTP